MDDGLATSHPALRASGLGVDVDRLLEEPEQPGQVGSHGRLVRSKLWSWASGRITSQLTTIEPVTAKADQPTSAREPGYCRARAISGRYPRTCSPMSPGPAAPARHRRRHGNDIGVGMPRQTPRVINPPAPTAQDQRPPFHQSMVLCPIPTRNAIISRRRARQATGHPPSKCPRRCTSPRSDRSPTGPGPRLQR